MAAGDLTTQDAVIAYLQTQPNISIDPVLIDTLITNASQFIKTYCSDNFVSTTYTELRDGDTTVSLGAIGWPVAGWSSSSFGYGLRPSVYVLAYGPVTAVSSVTVNGTEIQSAGGPPYQQGYIFDTRKLTILGLWVPPIPACVQIVYTAGYVTVLPDIDQACVELVAQKYMQRRRIGISSEAVSGVGSRTYTKADLQADTKEILNQRKRVAPVGNVISP